jgi:hypothetical protein
MEISLMLILSEVEASGIAVKKSNIAFTPGLTGALADFGPDILEVDTLTRDVALNGSYEGARAKLDVLTEFFFLQPGANEIEFADDKNSVSTGLLKSFLSIWLARLKKDKNDINRHDTYRC